ncbi:MAG: SMP-30/gluconolactonase/LRE family protein [Nocardioides sp.]
MSRTVHHPVPELYIPASALVGEGPVFDSRTDSLCWVDIPAGILHEHHLRSGANSVANVGTQLGAVAPRDRQPGFAAAVFDGFAIWAEGSLTVVDDVLADPLRRMNDAKCDSRGRLWAGSTHTSYLPGFGALHRWDGVGPSRVMADDLVLPNGIGWSPDDKTMYLADSFADVLLSAPFDATDGWVGEFTTLLDFEGGHPDGLCVDVDGCVWIAIWGGSEIRRYSPAGELIAIIPTPVSQPSSCAFGPDGTLYITSARDMLTPQELAGQPMAGSVFAAVPGVAGLPVAPFAA